MTSLIRKATRSKARLRLGLVAPSGAGKTYSSLKMAFGLGGKVGMIDTENGSGDLYAHLGDYDIITLNAPYTIKSYLDAIRAFENAGYDVIIIDSLSHAWAGKIRVYGGLIMSAFQQAVQKARKQHKAVKPLFKQRQITTTHMLVAEVFAPELDKVRGMPEQVAIGFARCSIKDSERKRLFDRLAPEFLAVAGAK